MLIHKSGDVFTTTLPAVAHGINLRGVMGSGIAVAIRTRFPDVYVAYKSACSRGIIKTGEMFPFYSPNSETWVLNVASQDLPGANARLDWLEDGLNASAHFCVQEGLAGFAAPRIGAGIGGLKWEDALEVFERVATTYPEIDIEVWTL